MALVRQIFGMQFSQKQGQMTQNNNKKCLPRRFKCGFEGSSSLQAKKGREKHTPKIKVATKNSEKEQHTGKQNPAFRLVCVTFSPPFRHKFPLSWNHATPSWSTKQPIGNKKSAHVTQVSYPVFLLSMLEVTFVSLLDCLENIFL